jgi:ribosomal-protein-alanine N-acetyltransferase
MTLAVVPGARRQGLGMRLLAGCLAEAAGRGATRMHLEVEAPNAVAIALYEAAGFVTTGRRSGYYAGRQGREDALIMSRDTASSLP